MTASPVRRRRSRWATAIAVGVVVLAGCAAGDDAQGTAVTPIEPAADAGADAAVQAVAPVGDLARADLAGLDLVHVPPVADVVGRSSVTGNRVIDDVRVVLGAGGSPDADVGRRFAVVAASEPDADACRGDMDCDALVYGLFDELRQPDHLVSADVLPLDVDRDGRADTLAWVEPDALVTAALDVDGALGEPAAIAVPDVLFDTRLAAAGPYVALYRAPTSAYDHGAAGDTIEALRLTVVDVAEGVVVRDLSPQDLLAAAGADRADDLAVFEGNGQLWADVDGDGTLDLLTTISDDAEGARIVAVLADRTVATAPIGRSNRWRHLLGVADLAGDGTPHVVEVLTPHLSRSLRAHVVEGDALVQVARRDGVVDTHAIGSRDLDTAVFTDVDGDGADEVVARPYQRPDVPLLAVGLVDGAWTELVELDETGRPTDPRR